MEHTEWKKMGAQSSRREMIKKAGKVIIPTLVTFQVSALKVRASGTLDTPKGNPFG